MRLDTLFEGTGLLLHRKLTNISIADDLYSAPIKTALKRMKRTTESNRERMIQLTIFEWFGYLYNEM